MLSSRWTKAGNIHVAVGKVSFPPAQIEKENARAVIDAVAKGANRQLEGFYHAQLHALGDDESLGPAWTSVNSAPTKLSTYLIPCA